MADTKDAMQDYLDKVDKVGGTGTMQGDRKEMPSTPIIRPFFGSPRSTSPALPSKAPYRSYGSMPIPDDIGAMRQAESQKVTRKKLGGKSISNPLNYRMPQTAIDAKYGPGDKVC